MKLVERGTVVLVVDDDAELRNSVAETLAMEGYEVRAVPSADAAWNELARSPHPAIVVLDLWLLGMTSGEFVRRLRASPQAGVPVLALSGGSPETGGLDVDAVARKPLEAAALVAAVDELVRRGRGTPDRPRPTRRRRPPSPTGRRRLRA